MSFFDTENTESNIGDITDVAKEVDDLIRQPEKEIHLEHEAAESEQAPETAAESAEAPQAEEKAARPERKIQLIHFNPRAWKLNPDCKNNQGHREVITAPNGKLMEGWTFEDINWSWTELFKNFAVEPDTDYVFAIWVKIQERRDNREEICQLQILPEGRYEDRIVIKLNRNNQWGQRTDYIKPLCVKNGWKLFEIPFTTDDEANMIQLRLVGQLAPCTFIPTTTEELTACKHRNIGVGDVNIDLDKLVESLGKIAQQASDVAVAAAKGAAGTARGAAMGAKDISVKIKNDVVNAINDAKQKGKFPFGNGDKVNVRSYSVEDEEEYEDVEEVEEDDEIVVDLGNNTHVHVSGGSAGSSGNMGNAGMSALKDKVIANLLDEDMMDELMDEIREEIMEELRGEILSELRGKRKKKNDNQ
jgi:hypothetical protein